ncbi:MAG: hypothetical protein Faunusvirus16_6 [Faunusvirus sp.]|jgi:hypothetical protein|uniref:Uncharacterized protein n=1 Tax=Faunusvirus sp. TaxID=2487766 RepID=A0A3G4ZX30_9VIRU|nr:MAG: hypothetical protein Faunusvirus16_6 [Faunusvirus sp.]
MIYTMLSDFIGAYIVWSEEKSVIDGDEGAAWRNYDKVVVEHINRVILHADPNTNYVNVTQKFTKNEMSMEQFKELMSDIKPYENKYNDIWKEYYNMMSNIDYKFNDTHNSGEDKYSKNGIYFQRLFIPIYFRWKSADKYYPDIKAFTQLLTKFNTDDHDFNFYIDQTNIGKIIHEITNYIIKRDVAPDALIDFAQQLTTKYKNM